MVTDEDRRMAIEQSQKRNSFHQQRGDRDGKISLRMEHNEILRRGFLGECAFANRFGGKVDYTLRPGGDGGRDFTLRLWTTNRGYQNFKVDIKTSTIRTVFATVADTTYLRVECPKIVRRTIYVGAIYLERTDDAEVKVWEWGRALMEWGEVLSFDGGPNFTKPFKDCRDLRELEERLENDAY